MLQRRRRARQAERFHFERAGRGGMATTVMGAWGEHRLSSCAARKARVGPHTLVFDAITPQTNTDAERPSADIFVAGRYRQLYLSADQCRRLRSRENCPSIDRRPVANSAGRGTRGNATIPARAPTDAINPWRAGSVGRRANKSLTRRLAGDSSPADRALDELRNGKVIGEMRRRTDGSDRRATWPAAARSTGRAVRLCYCHCRARRSRIEMTSERKEREAERRASCNEARAMNGGQDSEGHITRRRTLWVQICSASDRLR